MRKLNKSVIGLISISVITVLVVTMGIVLPAFLNTTEPIVISPGNILYSQYDDRYQTDQEVAVNSY